MGDKSRGKVRLNRAASKLGKVFPAIFGASGNNFGAFLL